MNLSGLQSAYYFSVIYIDAIMLPLQIVSCAKCRYKYELVSGDIFSIHSEEIRLLLLHLINSVSELSLTVYFQLVLFVFMFWIFFFFWF